MIIKMTLNYKLIFCYHNCEELQSSSVWQLRLTMPWYIGFTNVECHDEGCLYISKDFVGKTTGILKITSKKYAK